MLGGGGKGNRAKPGNQLVEYRLKIVLSSLCIPKKLTLDLNTLRTPKKLTRSDNRIQWFEILNHPINQTTGKCYMTLTTKIES